MAITLKNMRKFWIFGFALVGFGPLSACVTDDSDPGAEGETSTGGSGNATSSGTSGTTNSGSPSSQEPDNTGGETSSPATSTHCAASRTLDTSTPGIADFEGYDGGADLSSWSFALGGDSSTMIYAGPFGYGDDHVDAATNQEAPEEFNMTDGNGSTYALRIYDSQAEDYGGGMGIWLSDCLDASGFTGISFSVRGIAPTGDAKLTVLMEETTSEDSDGTCMGTDDDCTSPTFTFPVTDGWTEIQAAFSGFEAGSAAGTAVKADGHNIWQLQFDIGLDWLPDASGEYQPTPAEYELVVDDLTFY